MAGRFPVYERQVLPQGRLQVPSGEVTLGESFGAGLGQVGQGLDNVAQGLAAQARFARQQQDKKDQATATQAILQFGNDTDTALGEAQQKAPPGAPGFVDQSLQDFDKKSGELIAKIPPSAQDYAKEQLLRLRGGVQSSAMQFQVASGVAHTQDQLDEIGKQASTMLVNDPSKLDFAKTNVVTAIKALNLSPQREAAALKNADTMLSTVALDSLSTAAPERALAEMKSGQWDVVGAKNLSSLETQAKQQIDSNLRQKLAAQHERDYQAAKAQAVSDKAAKQQADINLSDMSIGIERGTVGYQDVEKAYDGGKGWLLPGQHTQAILALDSRSIKDAKAQAGFDFVAGAKAGAYQIDPKNADQMKAVDADYLGQAKLWATPSVDPAGGAEIPAKSPEQIRDLTLSYVTKLGVVPEALQGQVRGQLRNGSNEQMAASADLLEQFRQINPALLDDFSKPDVERASSIVSQVSAGVPVPKAVSNTIESEKVDPTTSTARAQSYDDLTKPPIGKTRLQTTQAEIQSAANTTWQRAVPFTVNPAVPPEMAGEYDLLKKEAYQRLGDMGQAQKSALDSIGRTWGQSAINGSVSWMKTPPESFYSAPSKYGLTPEENTAWMKDELVRDFTKGGMIDETAGPAKDRLSVVPSNRVNAQGQPLYQVMFKDSMGNLGPAIMTDKNGSTVPMLWAPDWQASPKKQELDAAQTKQLGQLETQRQTGVSPLMLGMMSPDQIKTLETSQQTHKMLVLQSAGPAAPTTAPAPASDSMLATQSAGPEAPATQAASNPSFLQRIIRGATDTELGVLIKQARGDVLDAAKAEKQRRGGR